MRIINAKVYGEDGTFQNKEIFIDKDRITDNLTSDDECLDATGLYAIPGLTDLHFHGCAGYDFCDGTHEAFEAIANYEAANGITTICPATMSLPEEILSVICENAATYESKSGALLIGINMEGPYLSVAKKGAQNEAYLRKPDLAMYSRLNELSGNLIKIVDIAPEEEGALEFISTISNDKVVSIAHTTADYTTSMEAFHRGASHVTHLYNAMLPLGHREPGLIGAAFDTPECKVELICDGIHIHPSVVRATFQLFGKDRVILISDSMMATGLPNGIYSLGGQEVQVLDKKATLTESGAIAGSATNLMECLQIAVKVMGIPLEVAIQSAAVNPAKEIGIYSDFGSITAGKVANIVLLDQDLNVKAVIIKGKVFNHSDK
ncbi:MAG: N-acetylglucosamine-6-phosphate deacetylase [Herbinix sp.]|jgi:N-acetylglucosamine-6-phosphate deacetylase|nr:N-acetylglucosamine-6-phosphate deacetylase [Herbinix sp.]